MEDQLHLVLGCFGLTNSFPNGTAFVSCRGVENRILRVSEALDFYEEMMLYIESVRLLDKPLFDMNAIRHFIHNMQDRYDQKFKRLWPESSYHLFERFILSHKSCGIYVKLVLVDPEQEEQVPQEPEKILVHGGPELKTQETPPNLKLIRGRR